MIKTIVNFFKKFFGKDEVEGALVDSVIQMPEEKVLIIEPVAKKSLNEKVSSIELPNYARGRVLPPKAKKRFVSEAKRRGSGKAIQTTDSSLVQGAAVGAMMAGLSVSEDPMVKEYVYMGDGMMEEVMVPRSEAAALHAAYSSPTSFSKEVEASEKRSDQYEYNTVHTPTYESSHSDSYSSCDSSSSYSSCD